jgi:hypothetical protein
MSSKKKLDQVRVRLEDEDVPVMEKLQGKSLSRADVTSVLLAAAFDAIREAGGHIGYWPPKFKIAYEPNPDTTRFNEPVPPAKHRK